MSLRDGFSINVMKKYIYRVKYSLVPYGLTFNSYNTLVLLLVR